MTACELPRFALNASAVCHADAACNANAACNASFGELLQGALPDERRFLVTLPIELRALASFSVPEHARELRVVPASSWNSLQLLDVMIDVAAEVGAAGIVVAHSGTYVGVLVDALRADSQRQISLAVSRLDACGLAPRVLQSLSSQHLPERTRA